jgi:transposase
MRFVAIKTPAQQSAMMLHRVRLVLSRQRTAGPMTVVGAKQR